jgi:hypothetical protein
LDKATEVPGSTVLLNGAEFKLAQTVVAIHFSGTLKGLGRDATTVHLLNGFMYNSESEVNAILIPNDPPAAWGLVFSYHPEIGSHTGEANLTVSDFTIVGDGEAGYVWVNNDGNESKEYSGMLIVGGPSSELGYQPTEVNFNIENLSLIGTSYPVDDEGNPQEFHPFLTDFTLAISTPDIYGGNHTIKNVHYENTGPLFVPFNYGTNIKISDIETDSIVAHGYDGAASIMLAGNRESTILVERLNTIDSAGVFVANMDVFGNPELDSSTYIFEHNNIQQKQDAGWAGFELWQTDSEYKDSFIISKNTITTNTTNPYMYGMGPIFTASVENAVITNNKVIGINFFAFFMEPFSPYGFGSGQNVTFIGNNMEQFTGILGNYLLEVGTSDYTLVGNVQDSVFDVADFDPDIWTYDEEGNPLELIYTGCGDAGYENNFAMVYDNKNWVQLSDGEWYLLAGYYDSNGWVQDCSKHSKNNIIVGVNNVGTGVGQDVSEAMMQQMEAKKQLLKP